MVEWAASRSGKVGSPKVQNGWALVSHLAGKPKLNADDRWIYD
jgi:hypothetical protein